MPSIETGLMDSLDYIEIEERPTEFSQSLCLPQTLQPEALKATDLSFEQTTHTQKMTSACAGSLITSLVATPFDVIKTRLQFQSMMASIPKLESAQPLVKCCTDYYFCSSSRALVACEWPVSNTHIASSYSLSSQSLTSSVKFTGTMDAFYKIARYEGLSKLWRGLSPALVQSFPSTVIYYVGYDALKDYLGRKVKPDSALSNYTPLFAGGLARSISATVISPIELFRTRLQTAAKGQNFKDIAANTVSMVRNQGIRSLWSGLGPTLWRDIPFSAIYWMGYESVKKELLDRTGDRFSHLTVAFVSGAASGVVAATVTTPFDVVKTRLQVESSGLKPQSTFQALTSIAQKEGWRELFRGLTPRVAKVAPACAIMVSSYEFGKKFFANKNALSST